MLVKKPSDILVITDNNDKTLINELIVQSTIDAQSKADEEYIGHLAAIVESSEDAIISKSPDGIIKSWNKGSEKMFGYTAKEVIGENISLIIPPEYINQEKDILKRICNNEIINHYETVRIKKSGEHFYVSLTASPLKDRAGNIIGVSKIARDITSGKKAELKLIDANKKLLFQNDQDEKRAAALVVANRDLEIADVQLKEANKELEAFSYSVSHDLRTPLRAVSGFSSMLKKKYQSKLDGEANRIIDVILTNTTMMGQLIDDLLTFSKMARVEAVNECIDMKRLAETCINELMQIETELKYTITVLPMPECEGDAGMLKQVWYNLINNAIKYSSKKDKPQIEIGATDNLSNNIYYIKDNGAGFNMKYADKLFGVFQRLHRQSEFEGTGLGLALVKRIISKHGGSIWAESILNEGTTFYFTIPKHYNYEQ